jgi:hypothetical protein
MSLDPRELFELDPERPDLTGSVLLHMMDGFSDAGSAVELTRAHLLGALDGEVIARFDVDQLYDYRARRPMMRLARDHWESYRAPELALHALHDDEGTPFLVLVGPEPDMQWERFVAAVRAIVDDLGIRLVVGINAFPMSLPHTRPPHVVLHGSRPELYEGYKPWLGTVGVPASIGHLIEFRLGEQGLDTLGLAATIPPYLSQTEYPAAAAALIREIGVRTGLALPVSALDEASEANRIAVDKQIEQSEDVKALVSALEQQYDSYARAQEDPLLDGNQELPSADELGAEFENYLAEQMRGGDTPQL